MEGSNNVRTDLNGSFDDLLEEVENPFSCLPPNKMQTLNTRSINKTKTYVDRMGNKCANPHCQSGFDVEGHHVVPISRGGLDKYWNMIALCHECHRQNHYHSRFEENMAELYVWKSLQEQEVFGTNRFWDEDAPGYNPRILIDDIVREDVIEIAEGDYNAGENKPKIIEEQSWDDIEETWEGDGNPLRSAIRDGKRDEGSYGPTIGVVVCLPKGYSGPYLPGQRVVEDVERLNKDKEKVAALGTLVYDPSQKKYPIKADTLARMKKAARYLLDSKTYPTKQLGGYETARYLNCAHTTLYRLLDDNLISYTCTGEYGKSYRFNLFEVCNDILEL